MSILKITSWWLGLQGLCLQSRQDEGGKRPSPLTQFCLKALWKPLSLTSYISFATPRCEGREGSKYALSAGLIVVPNQFRNLLLMEKEEWMMGNKCPCLPQTLKPFPPQSRSSRQNLMAGRGTWTKILVSIISKGSSLRFCA